VPIEIRHEKHVLHSSSSASTSRVTSSAFGPPEPLPLMGEASKLAGAQVALF
jgi:hypothetical protein